MVKQRVEQPWPLTHALSLDFQDLEVSSEGELPRVDNDLDSRSPINAVEIVAASPKK